MPKKYLILTASYGTGHNAAKNAIKEYLESNGDIVKVVDMIDFMGKKGINSKKFYEFCIEKMPILWQITFLLLEIRLYQKILGIYINLTYQDDFNKLIEEFKPDFVINLFPDWIKYLANYLSKNKKTFRTSTIVTDAIKIGLPWYYGSDAIDEYFVIDKWSKEVFYKKFYHKKDNINISFFPIEEKYFTDKNSLNNEQIIFLLSGIKEKFATELLELLALEKFYKKITICGGRNTSLFKLLSQKFNDKRIVFLDYPNIKSLLKENDYLIAKPGGAIMTECMANDTTLIAPTYIPGQEKGNIELLEKTGTGIFKKNTSSIIKIIKENDFSDKLSNFSNIKNKKSIEFIINIINSK